MRDDGEWIECPPNYSFSPGERVKMNPHSRFKDQALGKKLGTILSSRSHDTWRVAWDEGSKTCFYWREDLLIKNGCDEEYMKKREILKSKYKYIDPFEEEIWEY